MVESSGVEILTRMERRPSDELLCQERPTRSEEDHHMGTYLSNGKGPEAGMGLVCL